MIQYTPVFVEVVLEVWYGLILSTLVIVVVVLLTSDSGSVGVSVVMIVAVVEVALMADWKWSFVNQYKSIRIPNNLALVSNFCVQTAARTMVVSNIFSFHQKMWYQATSIHLYIVTLLTAMYLDGFIKGDILTMASLWGLKFKHSQEFPLNWSNFEICDTLRKFVEVTVQLSGCILGFHQSCDQN